MITAVGIGAYLGGSELLIDSPMLEEASGSILTVEARHDAYLRTGLGASPFPGIFDTGLSALWAFNMAQTFVISCPQELPFARLPALNVTSPMPPVSLQPAIAAGTVINLAWDPSTFFVPIAASEPLYIAMVNQNVSAPIFRVVTVTGQGTGSVPLPSGLGGAVFACLTTFSGGLTLDDLSAYGILAGPVQIVVS